MDLLLIPIVLLIARDWLRERSFAKEREGWRLREDMLLNRIQAPEMVIAQQASDPSEVPLWVDTEDPDQVEDYANARASGEVV